MHPRIDQLLSLRDGEPVDVEAREHIDSCAVCAASLHRLNERQRSLQGLSQFDAPHIDFATILARNAEAAPRIGRYRWLAAAAVVTAMVAGFVGIESQHAKAPQFATSQREFQDPVVAKLVEQSRELDQLLQELPDRQVQRVSLAGTVDLIEQRVQWLDMQLSAAPGTAHEDQVARRMWRERVDLMDSLVVVRYAESAPQLF